MTNFERLITTWYVIKKNFGARVEPRNGVFPIWVQGDEWCFRKHPSPRFTLDDLEWMVKRRELCGWALLQGFDYWIKNEFDKELNRYVVILRFLEELRNISIKYIHIDPEKPDAIKLVVSHKREGTELTIEPTRLCSNRRIGFRHGKYIRRTDCLNDYFNIKLLHVDTELTRYLHLWRGTRYLIITYKVWEKDGQKQQTQG